MKPEWVLVEHVLVPVATRAREIMDHPLSPPEVTVWETQYRWEAKFGAITKTLEPPKPSKVNQLAAIMLSEYSDRLSNDVCNDWSFPKDMDSFERAEFLAGYHEWIGDKETPLVNWLVADYLASLLEEQ